MTAMQQLWCKGTWLQTPILLAVVRAPVPKVESQYNMYCKCLSIAFCCTCIHMIHI